MPKEMEEKLKHTAAKRGYGKERADTYTYGTLRKLGWKPGHADKSYMNDEVDHSPGMCVDHKDKKACDGY